MNARTSENYLVEKVSLVNPRTPAIINAYLEIHDKSKEKYPDHRWRSILFSIWTQVVLELLSSDLL